MPRPTDEVQLKRFLDALREAGGSAGNYALMSALDLGESEYWRLREKLLEDGLVTRGRGRGGSVILNEQPPGTPQAPCEPAPASSAPEEVQRESDLYAACMQTLKEHWTKERGLQDFHLEICANQGARKTGGAWTRPDILAISMRTFRHWPGRYFDLWTFEIKPKWSFNVLGVFEATAHARASTQSYAMFHVDRIDELPDQYQRVVGEAQRLGVGLIFFQDPAEFKTWEIAVEPVRREPDPGFLEEMLAVQLSEQGKDMLIGRVPVIAQ